MLLHQLFAPASKTVAAQTAWPEEAKDMAGVSAPHDLLMVAETEQSY